MQVRTIAPFGDTFYLAHDNPDWDAFTFNFEKTGTTGGSVSVSFDDANKTLTIRVDNDAKYETILAALNDPLGTEGTAGWAITNPVGGALPPSNVPTVTHDPVTGAITGGVWIVNSQGDPRDPAVPTSLVSSTGSGVYRPHQYSADGRSTLVGNGLYLQHTDVSWDNININFITDSRHDGDIVISYDGTTLNVMMGTDVPYDALLYALNNPSGLASTWTDGTTTINISAWLRPNGSAIPTNQLPKANDLRWVDSNGMTATVTSPVAGAATGAIGVADLTSTGLDLTHLDPKWDNMRISFVAVATADAPQGGMAISGAMGTDGILNISVTYDSAAGYTYEDMLDALNGNWTGKPVGIGDLSWNSTAAQATTALPITTIANAITLGTVTYTTGGTVPYPPLNHTVNSGSTWREITANDIAAIFDLNNALSRGSERAAALFNVSTTVDNDGTGAMRLYDYYVNSSGKFAGYVHDLNLTSTHMKELGYTLVQTKTAFENVFGGGSTGGNVVTTAAELVTALNNSAYWGWKMCPELIAELAKENAAGVYYDATDPPVITAQLAPGNHGLSAVSTFQEVAYYGNPNDGTALQFLGDLNSPNIRFVVGGTNTQLSVDRTTVPAVEGTAQAVLTAQDSGASLTITAIGKGGGYDDVQFVFKRVGEDAAGLLSPDRRDGWVEYDPGTSFAYAQATFTDAVTGQSVANSAFYVTATERGDLYNNVDIVMRLDEYYTSPEPVTVFFDSSTKQLRISIDSSRAGNVTTNDIIAAINKANVGFNAELSYSEDPLNNGLGTLANVGLSSSRFTSVANTGNTGGHEGGTVTVWLADANAGPGAPDSASAGVYRSPTQEDIVRLINTDPVVGKMFSARAYNTVQATHGKQIDFVNDGPIVTSGGLIQPALITVHLATDAVGNVTTTAADLEKWWNSLNPALVDNISVSVVRPAGAVWDDCNDPYGYGLLGGTVRRGECDEWIINDIQFVGWDNNAQQQHYVAQKSMGIMTSQNGINSSYQLIAKNLGPEWDGYTIEYIHDSSVTGYFADNLVSGAGTNPCDDPIYSGLQRDDCGTLITPNSTTEKGLRLIFDEATKKIIVYMNQGRTTANDIQQLINNDPRTRKLFEVVQLGNGSGVVSRDDNTLQTTGGAAAPGNLNGAKLLFGSDATDYYLIFRSTEYGSNKFVDVQASSVVAGGSTSFTTSDKYGNTETKTYGKDVDALINGIKATASGLNASINTSSLAVSFTFSEHAGTTAGYATGFSINGGGATFQVGPDVVSQQQITMGIRSINTVLLGGASGVLNQLREGQDADLRKDPNKAFRIVQESLLAITSIRGRLGTMQRATLETNINVLNDTLSALTEAESQIRDTNFAEETSNMTRAQILVQANMNTLGIANQIPNYMLSLLGR
jgi:flagellin-like hook-associated protein FlgL